MKLLGDNPVDQTIKPVLIISPLLSATKSLPTSTTKSFTR